jgi:hypothetical protein
MEAEPNANGAEHALGQAKSHETFLSWLGGDDRGKERAGDR